MKLLFDWFVTSFIDNIIQCKTMSLCWNLIFGLIISIIVCAFLYKGAQKEGSYYEFRKTEVIPTSFWLMLGMVLLAPPFPLRNMSVWGILSMASCFAVFGITSFTDTKTGFFTAGYMIAGLLISIVLSMISLPNLIRTADKMDWISLLICMGINLLLGLFAYRFGDALLFLMGQFTICVCMEPNQWMLSMLSALMIAMVTYVLQNLIHIKQVISDKKTRFPFTLHLFIGVLASFFLMQ